MTEKNQISTKEFYELDNFNRHRPFLQIGMVGGTSINLNITIITKDKVRVMDAFSLNEYPFFLFLLCFYDSKKEDYDINYSGEKIINKSYEEIIKNIEKIELFLENNFITLKLFNNFFSKLDFNNTDSHLYVEYINDNKIFFQIITVQLKEWLNKNLKDKRDYQFLAIGY